MGVIAGKILRIDLSNQRIDIQQLDESLIKEYIGGSGIGTKKLTNLTGYPDLKKEVLSKELYKNIIFSCVFS